MILSQLRIGQSAKIKHIRCDAKTKSRLAYMGVTEGTVVTVIRLSPFNDPIEIKVRDFYLAIRKNEADKIDVYED
ncbi:MAG: ferrous iron transport protein A [Clostridia bacterium]|nr:ferrous iron transport protein A [Clostridia bacterium]